MGKVEKSRAIPDLETLGLVGSDRVIITQDDDGLRITTMEQSLKRVRELAKPYRPKSGYVSDELVADRRAEAAREDEAGLAQDG